MEKRMFEIRKFSQDEGTFEAYVATWDTLDSFGTRFKKGAFRKTISERLRKGDIKILWQHKIDEPIGVVMDAREDDHGLLIHGRLDIGVPKADQARTQMTSGTINQLSFGFDIIKQKRNPNDGFIDISEVRWWEASPVTFASNPTTSVVNVRSSQVVQDGELIHAEEGDAFTVYDEEIVHIRSITDDPDRRLGTKLGTRKVKDDVDDGADPNSLPDDDDGSLSPGSSPSSSSRAADFDETFDQAEMMSRGYRILNALMDTLFDIWYVEDVPDVVAAIDDTFEKAHASYVEWAAEIVLNGTRGEDPRKNVLSEAMAKEVGERSLEEVAKDSSLSVGECRKLLKGELLPLDARARIAELSEEVAKAHSLRRGEVVTGLFAEIRAKGFSQPEMLRLKALLETDPSGTDHESDDENEVGEILSSLRSMNANFKK